jgi:PilZ domain-containing protein
MVPMLAKSAHSALYTESHPEVSTHLSLNRQERRRRVRTPVHLAVYFFGSEHRAAVETVTQNLSSGGFYFVAPIPFPVNEVAFCYIKIPIYQPDRTEQMLALKCRVRVVRVELLGEAEYGVGCEIEDYLLPEGGGKRSGPLPFESIE